MSAPRLHGTASRRFEPVRQIFAESLESEEIGASLCVWHDGQMVVDLWGGARDRDSGAPWQEETIATVFSCTKGIVALAFLLLEQRGQLDYDAPVARYWPDFAQGDKGSITVRTLLNHRAGLLGIDAPISLDMLENNPERIDELCAAQAPRWEPGADQGYHGVTFGLYAAALFRRITGESLGSFIAREITGPLGAEFHLGLPETHEERVATNYPVSGRERLLKIVPKLLFHRGTEGRVYRSVALGGDAAVALGNPRELGPRGIDNFNSERVHRLELPWGNGIGNARGLCRIYAALLSGELAGTAAIEPIGERQSWSDRDRVLNKPVGWSQGFLKEGATLFSPNPESFGHAGAGGGLGWCDPVARIAIGYVMNRMDHHVRSPRALRLCHTIYRCL